MQSPILILGVPRSGTSLTAQLVHAWGAYSGDAQQLHKADEWNKAGYYEFLPVRVMVKRMLGRNLAPLEERFDVFEEPARELVREMTAACPSDRPWFWKVPEMTPLLPFWKRIVEEVAGTPPICIVVVRNPLASANSQKSYFEQKMLQANAPDFPYAQALVVWQYYMAFLLNNADPERTIYVSMEDLVSDGQSVGRLKHFLDRVYGGHDNDVMATIPRTMLVHQRDHDLASLTTKQRRLYEILRQQTHTPTAWDDEWRSLLPTMAERQEIRAIEQWVGEKIAVHVRK